MRAARTPLYLRGFPSSPRGEGFTGEAPSPSAPFKGKRFFANTVAHLSDHHISAYLPVVQTPATCDYSG